MTGSLKAARMLLAGIVCAASPGHAAAGPVEAEVFQIFKGFCIYGLNNPDDFPNRARTIGAIELEADKAKPFLEPQTGRAWGGQTPGNTAYVVVLTAYGVCAVFSTDARAEIVQHLLDSDPVFRRSERLSWSLQGEHGYTAVMARRDGGPDFRAAVMLSLPPPGLTGMRLGAIPERTMKELKLETPNWPNAWRPN